MTHELVRSLFENRPHAEPTDLPALNLRRESFDHILPWDWPSDGQVSRDFRIAEDLTVPCIEIANVKWPEPQSLSLDLGHLVSMAVRLRPLPPAWMSVPSPTSPGATLRSWLAISSFVRHDRAMPEPSRR
jgi:hypothetical protein